MDEAGVDFAVVAWCEEGDWHVASAPSAAADRLPELADYARRRQGESGSLAFVSVADEFFVCLRIQGSRVRLLLSDVTAALDWPIADEAAEMLGVDVEDLEEAEEIEPAGDLTLLSDLGLAAHDVDLLCSDPELYPDEQIGSIAARIGFGRELSAVLDVA